MKQTIYLHIGYITRAGRGIQLIAIRIIDFHCADDPTNRENDPLDSFTRELENCEQPFALRCSEGNKKKKRDREKEREKKWEILYVLDKTEFVLKFHR